MLFLHVSLIKGRFYEARAEHSLQQMHVEPLLGEDRRKEERASHHSFYIWHRLSPSTPPLPASHFRSWVREDNIKMKELDLFFYESWSWKWCKRGTKTKSQRELPARNQCEPVSSVQLPPPLPPPWTTNLLNRCNQDLRQHLNQGVQHTYCPHIQKPDYLF